jgi:hypothetical protein
MEGARGRISQNLRWKTCIGIDVLEESFEGTAGSRITRLNAV